ncbi:MAG: cyclic pyranopterin monophosphate synthase MoaC, partial [Pseudomonadota bacterium]|nr:cyclic pyranopterin monophosphate synthase MoaC [Pseudomonadota bacterium]
CQRRAVAMARMPMQIETMERIVSGETLKGDVLTPARVAGVLGAKRTSDIIPMCHHVPLDMVELSATFDYDTPALELRVTVKATGRAGVEIEAMTAVMAAALTVFELVKHYDRTVFIEQIRVLEKRGGDHEFTLDEKSE